jgi:uncharacterized protein YdaU (DUF1376 family)
MNAPYVQLDADRFLADTDWLTLEEAAVYGRLLFRAWKQEPTGTLPDDDLMLSRLARVDLSKWQEVKPAVLSLFKLGKDKRWHHIELRANFERLRLKRKNGQKAAQARWSKSDEESLEDADAMQTHSRRNANASNPHSERNAFKDKEQDKEKDKKKKVLESESNSRARAPAGNGKPLVEQAAKQLEIHRRYYPGFSGSFNAHQIGLLASMTDLKACESAFQHAAGNDIKPSSIARIVNEVYANKEWETRNGKTNPEEIDDFIRNYGKQGTNPNATH